MKDYGRVRGSKEQAELLIVGKDTVYVHTDVVITGDNETEYEYGEIQYDKDEYIQLMSEKSQQMDIQMTDTQMALVEIYEGMV